jgi:hypothetical protein
VRAALCALTVFAALARGADEAAAQTAGEVLDACVEAGGDETRCADAAVAARALMGQVGLLAGGGSEVPGAASTLGRRLGSTPRTAVSLRIGGIGAGHPDLAAGGVGAAADEVSYFVPSVQGSVALGLTDGFAPLPTVGGLLSLDVLAQAGLLFLPESKGFGGATAAFSLGARLGLLRESFTLPGVSVSVSRRFIGDFELDGAAAGATRIELDPAATSLRVTVGKDLFAVGVLAGLGWDFYSGEGALAVPAGMVFTEVDTTLDASRRLIFLGASLSFVVLQISAEGGWAQGFDPVSGYADSPFDAAKGSAFGGLAVRLIL